MIDNNAESGLKLFLSHKQNGVLSARVLFLEKEESLTVQDVASRGVEAITMFDFFLVKAYAVCSQHPIADFFT